MEKEIGKQSKNLYLQADMEGHYLLDEDSKSLKLIGIFYAPSGGNVHKIARQIKRKLPDYHPEMFCLDEISPQKLLEYQNLILVCSSLGRNTWEMEQKDKWSGFSPEMRKLKLNTRRVAVVGMGDHVTYPNNFVDVIGFVADAVEEAGGILIGATPTLDYVFNDSKALKDGKFMGLPLDEDFEPEKTDKRIDDWLENMLPLLNLK